MEFGIVGALLELEALEEVRLPQGGENNVFRGALGMALRATSCNPACNNAKTCPLREGCLYARFFEPVWEDGPSGYKQAPRPFVLRCLTSPEVVAKGNSLPANVLLFITHDPPWQELQSAFSRVASDGLGTGRGRARLKMFDFESHPAARLSLPLHGDDRRGKLRLRFSTPVELKVAGEVFNRPEFSVLVRRLLARIWALGHLYQGWTNDWDTRGLLDLAPSVRLLDWSWRHQQTERRSSKTGQRHYLGGFVGWAEYEGPVGAFLPLLEIARWTGVGRQTVWGKGQLHVEQVTWDGL